MAVAHRRMFLEVSIGNHVSGFIVAACYLICSQVTQTAGGLPRRALRNESNVRLDRIFELVGEVFQGRRLGVACRLVKFIVAVFYI
jgi:hypothetical protein